MKILKVIHGYPPVYNAGSEVYSQTLCQKLADKHEVEVFTREENPFLPDYVMRESLDSTDNRIKLNIINIPIERRRYQYRSSEVDRQFKQVLEKFVPDIIHVGHLNHLSISLLEQVHKSVPIIYTLHDYWLMCPRGQFIQRLPVNAQDLWAVCDGQDNLKCALRCYGGYFSGSADDYQGDLSYWASWVKSRMSYVKEVLGRVDYFIAPAKYLLNKFQDDFGLDKNKLIYLDYGFDLKRLQNRKRVANESFTFGYIGTHIPAKGIQLLIKAFGKLNGDVRLRIWGRDRGENTKALKTIAASLSEGVVQNIEWLPEYTNQNIVSDVFDHVDVIVVPSIWYENSPLVIHEALQVGVPVITADIGGMSEYVKHEVNGLLFKHRDVDSLAQAMQYLCNRPELANKLGEKGYLQSVDGNIPSVDQHVIEVEKIYQHALSARGR